MSLEYDVSVEYGGCHEAVVAGAPKEQEIKKTLPKDHSPMNHTYNPSIQQVGTNYTCTYRDI